MHSFPALPEKVRMQILAYVLPRNLAIDLESPFRVKHALFSVSESVKSDAFAVFARLNKFHLWVWGLRIDDDNPQLSLPDRPFLAHITRVHLLIRANTLNVISNNFGFGKLILDGAQLAGFVAKFKSLELLVIGIPKLAPPEHIDEDLLIRLFEPVRTSALVVVDGKMTEEGKEQLLGLMSTTNSLSHEFTKLEFLNYATVGYST